MDHAERQTLRKNVEAAMAGAVHYATGRDVEVTLCGPGRISACGEPGAVEASRAVFLAAGLVLDSTAYDAELGECFDYWLHT